jgi:hypothetical protein
MRRSSSIRVVCTASALAIAVAACGGSESDSDSVADTTATTAAPTAAPTTTTPPPPERCDWSTNTVGFWEQEPPTEPLDEHQHANEAHSQGNEHGVQAWVPLADVEQCAELSDQIARMEMVAQRYPTLQDATDAGCFKATIYIPGIAAHLYCVSHHTAGTDIERPTMLLYGGNKPEAPIVGLSYMVYTDDAPSDAAHADLWVRYMPWHFHEGLCIKNGLVIGGDNSDQAKCEAAGGKVQGRTGWMGHYWLANCPSPDGVFSAANPRLDWEVGKHNDAHAGDDGLVEAPCQGTTMTIEPEGDDAFGKPDDMDPHFGMDHAGHGEPHDQEHHEH